MSTEKDDGGAAFPRLAGRYNDDVAVRGMSLRDWFAGQALAGFAAYPGNTVVTEWTWDVVAEGAYMAADAMLKARKR